MHKNPVDVRTVLCEDSPAMSDTDNTLYAHVVSKVREDGTTDWDLRTYRGRNQSVSVGLFNSPDKAVAYCLSRFGIVPAVETPAPSAGRPCNNQHNQATPNRNKP